MPIRSIEITGLRGFARTQKVEFAQPTGAYGSGLTLIVGPNNAGKSTVIEALRAHTSPGAPAFTEGKRNKRAGDRVSVEVTLSNGGRRCIRTVDAGGSETVTEGEQGALTVYILPSRRTFSPYFGQYQPAERSAYTTGYGLPQARGQGMDQFASRLLKLNREPQLRVGFDELLGRVLGYDLQWVIEQSDQGSYYLKIAAGEGFHTSDGLGDGLVSLLFLVDAFYDSVPTETIVVDEPELSLHPQVQRRLATRICEFAADRQIVVATHSPYFVDWKALAAGGNVVRLAKKGNECRAFPLPRDTSDRIRPLLDNRMNPHILELHAREVFFLDDAVILVEGQEDVVCYQRIAAEMRVSLPGTFFGWGVGGAGNMEVIAEMLQSLGFERVVGILDANRGPQRDALTQRFPSYTFLCIPAADVRTKEARGPVEAVEGLLDEDWRLRDEYRDRLRQLFTQISDCLRPAGRLL